MPVAPDNAVVGADDGQVATTGITEEAAGPGAAKPEEEGEVYMKSEIAQLYVTALANGAWSADFTCLFESSLTSRARLNVAAFLYAAREEVTRQRLAAPEPPMFAGPPMPPMPFGTGFNFRPPAPMNWNPGPAPFNPPRASFPRHVSFLFPRCPCCTLQEFGPL